MTVEGPDAFWYSCRWGSPVIILCRQPEGGSPLLWAGLKHRTSKPIPTVMHFLQQGHTYSNEATLPNSATSHGPSVFRPSHSSFPHMNFVDNFDWGRSIFRYMIL